MSGVEDNWSDATDEGDDEPIDTDEQTVPNLEIPEIAALNHPDTVRVPPATSSSEQPQGPPSSIPPIRPPSTFQPPVPQSFRPPPPSKFPPPRPPATAPPITRDYRINANAIAQGMNDRGGVPRRTVPTTTRHGVAAPPEDLTTRINRLGSRVETSQKTIERYDRQASVLRSRVEILDDRLAELEERFSLDALDSTGAARLEERLGSVEVQLQSAEHDTSAVELGERVEKLESALDTVTALESRLTELEHQLGARLDLLGRQLAEMDRRNDAVRAESERLGQQLAKTCQRLGERLDSLEEARAAAPRKQISKPPPAADDLTAIRGIGPVFARALSDAGVQSYAQMASWTAADMERVAEKIGTTSGRIRRAGWIASAKRLARRAAKKG